MLGKLKKFYRAKSRYFAATLTFLIVVTWLLGPVLLNVLTPDQSALVSFAIIIVILSTIQDYLNDLVRVGPIHIAADQDDNTAHLIAMLSDANTIGSVKMIEYDSESTKALIYFFLQKGATVHCLLQHPEHSINESQRNRTVLQILCKEDDYFGFSDRITFSYYRNQASLRGRLIDDKYISVGWYTYDYRGGIPGRQVWGHNNPVVTTERKSLDGDRLSAFFTQVFDNLVEDSESWDDLSRRYTVRVARIEENTAPNSVRLDLVLESQAAEIGSWKPVNRKIRYTRTNQPDGRFLADSYRILRSGFPEQEWTAESIGKEVVDPSTLRVVFTARSDDTLVGFVTLHTTETPGMCRLHWLAVDKQWRRQGVGLDLVYQFCQVAVEKGFTHVTLDTEDYRTGALQLYRRVGFTGKEGARS